MSFIFFFCVQLAYVAADAKICLLSQHPFNDSFLPVSLPCVVYMYFTYFQLCTLALPFWNKLTLEILHAFLLLVNIGLIFQYLIPALYAPVTLWGSLFSFSFFPFFFLLKSFILIQALSFLKTYNIIKRILKKSVLVFNYCYLLLFVYFHQLYFKLLKSQSCNLTLTNYFRCY